MYLKWYEMSQIWRLLCWYTPGGSVESTIMEVEGIDALVMRLDHSLHGTRSQVTEKHLAPHTPRNHQVTYHLKQLPWRQSLIMVIIEFYSFSLDNKYKLWLSVCLYMCVYVCMRAPLCPIFLMVQYMLAPIFKSFQCLYITNNSSNKHL